MTPKVSSGIRPGSERIPRASLWGSAKDLLGSFGFLEGAAQNPEISLGSAKEFQASLRIR
eukprot:5622392-Pyramimonas_sp.AAC.1